MIGTSMKERTASEARLEMRQQPMAQSVPSRMAKKVEAVAMTKLWKVADSQISLVKKAS